MIITKLLAFSENDAMIKTKEDEIMKRITLTVLIAIFVLLGIVGCNDSTDDVSNPKMSIEASDMSSFADNASECTHDEMNNISDISAENESSKSQSITPGTESSEYTEPSVEDSSEVTEESSISTETSEEESSEPSSSEDGKPESSEPTNVESEPDEPDIEVSEPSEESKEESITPETSEEESSTHESSEESEESQPTEESEPDESEPPISSEPEVSEEASSEAEPEPFDIDYWIEYARDYAESVGLILHESAVDCWDNAIGAGSHCIYLERDIQDRLNGYARDEEITWVWIWAEEVRDNYYNLYIGYA